MTIYENMETIFTEEEQKILGTFDEDEDYTILSVELIEKLIEQDKSVQNSRQCNFNLNYLHVIVNWFRSWFV